MIFFGMLSLVLLLCLCGSWIWFLRMQKKTAAQKQAAEALAQSQKRLYTYEKGLLIRGLTPSFDLMADYARIFGLDYPCNEFMLLVVKVRHHRYGDAPTALSDAYAAAQEELTGILGLYAAPEFVETEGVLVCFYCEPRVQKDYPESGERLRTLLAQHCAACAATLLDRYGIDVLIALGNYDAGGFGLHSNYLSTRALLDQAMCSKWAGNVVVDAQELTRKTDPEFTSAQRQFYNCFVCFQYEDAAQHLFQMVELRIRDYYDSFPEAKETVAAQIRFCVNMLELPLNIQLPLEDGGTIDIRAVMASPDEKTLQSALRQYFGGLACYVQGSTTKAVPTTARVRSYIEANYQSSTISVSGISEHFGLNISYLSRQFKQEYNCGLLEFIHRTRIARAKELIAQGVPLGQIPEQVGYTSRRAMDSAFTRYEGITPKAYDTQLHAVHSA